MGEPKGEPRLTHTGADGDARMVDVGEKPVTARVAEAEGYVYMLPTTLSLVRENASAKGDVLSVARIAGLMAAKKTAELIPLCHGLPLDHAEINFELNDEPASIHIRAEVRVQARTGIEMEALTAVAIAGLTVYDMLKAVDRSIVIGGIRVTHKSGGRSGLYQAGGAATPTHIP